MFKISNIEGNSASTEFDGCEIANDQLNRVVRKGTQNVEVVNDIKTKDNWELQLKSVSILNRKTNRSIQTEVRHAVRKLLEEYCSTMDIDELMKNVGAGVVQFKVKKQLNKIYPVRACEITKVEVVKRPEA